MPLKSQSTVDAMKRDNRPSIFTSLHQQQLKLPYQDSLIVCLVVCIKGMGPQAE
jgi:hypothetical protein